MARAAAAKASSCKSERELVADGRGVGHRLDVHGQQRPQRRGGERGRAIAGDDAQHERGDERDGEGVEREVDDAERQRARAEGGDDGAHGDGAHGAIRLPREVGARGGRAAIEEVVGERRARGDGACCR